MVTHTVDIAGSRIVDGWTHYEAHPYIGPEQATVIIRGDIAQEFQKRYGLPITEAATFKATLDFSPNGSRIKGCQDVFMPASHLVGYVMSIDDIDFRKD